VSFHLGQESSQRSTDVILLPGTIVVSEKQSSERFDDTFLEDINPDEEMAILDHLLELQQHDHDYENARKLDDEQLKEVNGELEKGESMLLQLRESLKVYHSMKSRYEELMTEVQVLESQKANLARQLDQATADPSIGCSVAIKQKLEKVENNLFRARRETMTHREKYRLAEDQARKCKVLERKVSELKNAKVMLLKKQTEAAARYKEMTEAKTKELTAMKRRQKVTDKRMSKLKNELSLHKKTLEKRKVYCTKLSEKLKQTEGHLVKLLSMRQRDLARRTSVSANRRGSVSYGLQHSSNHTVMTKPVPPLSESDIKATKYVFDRMVWDKVKQARERKKYEALVTIYGETMRKVVIEVKKLEELRATFQTDHSVGTQSTIRETEEDVADLELKLELLDSELNDTAAQIPNDGSVADQDIDEAVSKLLSSMTLAALKSLLMDSFAKIVEAEVCPALDDVDVR
jgi:DNA repair exonuclease SbcCD ATPase subunit